MSDSGLVADIGVEHPGGFVLDAAFAIPPGGILAMVGPNGAGKSTIVSALCGLIPLDRGSIRLGGRVLADHGTGASVAVHDRRIGVMFQDDTLFPHLTVRRNIEFGLRATGQEPAVTAEMGERWLERLDLAAHAERLPGELSGGEARRVALARAVATNPDLLILDEPLTSLDITTRTTVRRAVAEFLESFEGPSLVITHEPADAFMLADSICIVEGGRIVQTGTAAEIRLRPGTPYAADLVGVNMFAGSADGGTVVVGEYLLSIPDRDLAGAVTVTIHPRAIALHRTEPEGSPRNTWATAVVHLEDLGDTARIETGLPLPVTAEVTTESVRSLGLAIGVPVWVSVKATEIGVRDS
ncbi:MAG: ABC transporter ATP-binding protein [Acidimicrobiia bacterium]